MYAVCVKFDIKDGHAARFMPLIRDNAQASLRNEEGCLQFDVLSDPSKPDTVFLYEIYSSRAAFDIHLASDHFHRFDAATKDMIAAKDIQTWTEVTQ